MGMKIFIAAILSTTYLSANAGLDADKKAGECAAYMIITKKDNGARAALLLADNQQRATQIAAMKLQQIKRYAKDKDMMSAIAYETYQSCRDMGIRQSDY